MKFDAHGDFAVSLQGDILYFQLDGSFNREGVLQSCICAQELIKASCLEDWHILFKLSDETLLVWEAVADVRNFLKWCYKNRCRSFAYIVKSEPQQAIVKKIFQTLDLNVKCFFDESEALSWLKLHPL